MTVAEKLSRVALNVRRVFAAGVAKGLAYGDYGKGVADGRQAERAAFWEHYLSEGSLTRASYMFAEPRFGDANFYPTRDIRPVGRAQNLFYNFGAEVRGVKEDGIDLRERLNECGVSLDLSQATNLVYCFAYTRFTGLPALDLTGCGSETINVFENMFSLLEIDGIKVDADNVFDGWFTNCAELREVRFSGIIAHDIDLHWSKKLSRDSIDSLFWICNESQGYDFKVTLSRMAVNKAYETATGANDGSASEAWGLAMSYSHQTVVLL